MYLTTEQFEALPYPKGCECSFEYKNKIKLIDNKLIAKKITSISMEKIRKYFDVLGVQYGKANGSFIFPIEKLYIDDIYLGCVMQYIDNLEVTFTDFNQFLLLTEKVKKDLSVLNENGLVATDLHDCNCLFDTQFRFIDTTDYEFKPYLSKEQLTINNYKNLNHFFKIILFIYNGMKSCSMDLFFQRSDSLARLYYRLCDNKEPIFFSDFLSELMDKEKVYNISEFEQKVRKYI